MKRLLAAVLLASACSGESAPPPQPGPVAATPAPSPAPAAAPATAPVRRATAAAPEEPPPELTSAAFKHFVERRAKDVRRCYDAALQHDPALHGKVKLQFNILPSGEIADVKIASTSFPTRAVPGCVAEVFRSWRTPFRPEEPVGIEYPLSFAPRG